MIREYKILKNYLLYFLIFLLVCIVGISGVFAETITDMTFSQFRTTIDAYPIIYNPYIYDTSVSVPVNMGINPNGFAFEWITNYTNKCSGQTIINGQMAIPNDNLNYDWFYENIKDIYYAPNISGVDGTPCTFSINPDTSVISYTCSTAQPNNNFIIGGHLKYRSNTNFNTYFRIYRTMNITCDNSASSIIDSNNQNTQNIINNNNQNTQDIINNNNQNTQDIIDSNKVCTSYDKNSIVNDNSVLSSSGAIGTNSNYGVSDYININNSDVKILKVYNYNYSGSNVCYYDVNKSVISCQNQSNLSQLTVPDNSYYLRFTIYKAESKPTLQVCRNGNQALDDSINNLDDTLNDDDTSDAENEASEFFSSFDTETFGLTSIITAPLNLIRSVLTSNCTTLQLPLPYLDNKKLELPCMSTIYSEFFGSFFTIYQTITYGIIAYWVCVRIFNQVKDFKNPEHDEIEVMDL